MYYHFRVCCSRDSTGYSRNQCSKQDAEFSCAKLLVHAYVDDVKLFFVCASFRECMIHLLVYIQEILNKQLEIYTLGGGGIINTQNSCWIQEMLVLLKLEAW